MYQLTALYAHPEDIAAFDAHYDGVHAPLARKIPGLLRYTVSRPVADAEGNKPPYHLVAGVTHAARAAPATPSSFGAALLRGGPASGRAPGVAAAPGR